MKNFYAICGIIGIICAIMYWTGDLEISNVVVGCYVFGWSCMCIAEALRKTDGKD